EMEKPLGGKLRELLTGGDALRRRPRAGESFRLVNHYGPTENTVVATSGEVAGSGEGAPGIGRPVANVQVYVLGERMEPVAVGVVGELCIGGGGVGRGELKSPRVAGGRVVAQP